MDQWVLSVFFGTWASPGMSLCHFKEEIRTSDSCGPGTGDVTGPFLLLRTDYIQEQKRNKPSPINGIDILDNTPGSIDHRDDRIDPIIDHL